MELGFKVSKLRVSISSTRVGVAEVGVAEVGVAEVGVAAWFCCRVWAELTGRLPGGGGCKGVGVRGVGVREEGETEG